MPQYVSRIQYNVICVQYTLPFPSLRLALLSRAISFPQPRPFCTRRLNHQKNSPQINQRTNTPPTIIPDSFRIATLFPLAAMRPSRPAEPFREVDMEENVSEVLSITSCALALSYISTVTPLSAETFEESSASRELFWRSRS